MRERENILGHHIREVIPLWRKGVRNRAERVDSNSVPGTVNFLKVGRITKKIDSFLFQVSFDSVVLKLFTIRINSFQRNVTQKLTT